jgi:hypothetical protein
VSRARALLQGLWSWWGARSRGTQGLLLLWALFALLVGSGVHGSSIGANLPEWAPEAEDIHTLMPVAELLKSDTVDLSDALQLNDRGIRSDEWLVSTPWALAQLSHKPRFPVINTNIGMGQNMLLVIDAPVLHIATLARPSTWGYFFLGPTRGLAWHWWSQPFACFTALYLLLELVLSGKRALAAFGAFWYCASAYVILWSNVPGKVVFFPVLGCLATYRLLTAETRRAALVWGVLLGLAVPGFVMAIYPPWQVSVALFSLVVFVGLFLRDKLFRYLRRPSRNLLLGFGTALGLAGLVTGSFVISALPAIRIVNQTVYPGRRISTGGDFVYSDLFRGAYNLLSNVSVDHPDLINQSEAASFYHLFPLVLLGLLLLPRLRKRFDVLGWLLVAQVVCVVLYMLVGVPEWFAKATLLKYVYATRADIALGLGSTFLCAYALSRMDGERTETVSSWETGRWLLGSLAIFLLFYHHGLLLAARTEGVIPRSIVLLISLLLALLAYLFYSGRALAFAGAFSALLVVTSFWFNPLAGSLNAAYDTPLAQEIRRLSAHGKNERPPLWLSFGSIQLGVLIYVLGGRSLTGVHFTPELALWRSLDPSGRYEHVYNRYARLSLSLSHDPERVKFSTSGEGRVRVQLSPHHPELKAAGARYVIAKVKAFKRDPGMKQVYRAPGGYAIFEIL